MDLNFLSPVNENLVANTLFYKEGSIGKIIKIHSVEFGFPNLEDVSIVILGVKESRNAVNNFGCGEGINSIRSKLYELFASKWKTKIADIGDIEEGNVIEDTYCAVSEIISSLLKKNIIPIIIGGSQDLTYANYRSYDSFEQTVNLVSVDSRLDLGSLECNLTSNSYLSKIIIDTPNNLFNYSNIGCQTYFNSNNEIDLLNKLYFDIYRLGELKNIELVEPVMRDADIVSIDIGSVRASDAPANKNTSPNGFYGEDICAISRYAGISDKVSSFGIYEFNNSLDIGDQTALLIAQMIWYFIEGVNNRAKDYPFVTKDEYDKFIVLFVDDEPINFYKSNKSDRWWMEINLITNNKYKRHTLISCTYQDYVRAMDNKIPERWYRALQKLT